MKVITGLLIALFLCGTFDPAYGHGRLMEPPSRSSLWRFLDDAAIRPYRDIVEPNYNDNQLFCGGYQHQKNLGGKCGVCGDPYDGLRDNEAGGKYAKGIIVRNYGPGDVMLVTIELTAHHKGYFEFRLCPWDNPEQPVTQTCLDQHLLEMDNGTKLFPKKLTESKGVYNINVYLPDGVNCAQCVLQWRYHTGNSWGCDDSGCGLGYGPQEEFYGCADISIGTTEQTPSVTTKRTTTQASTILSPSTTSSTRPSPVSTSEGVNNENPCQWSLGIVKKDCHSFYMCMPGNDGPYVSGWHSCPVGTVFNEEINMCDHGYNLLYPCEDE